VLDICCST
jgi:hypothetical protein